MNFKKNIAIITIGLYITTSFAQTKADTTSIYEILQNEVTSWNNGDAIEYSKHFSKEGTFTNILGMFFIGQKAFIDRHEDIFKGKFKGTKLELKLESMKFIRADVAIIENLTTLSNFSNGGPPQGTALDKNGRLITRLLQVMTKQNGRWQTVTYHNIDVKPLSIISK